MATDPNPRTDDEELKEVIKEFLFHLDWAYHYRLQKLVFYGEVWCLQTYGKRLTDADFLAHHHGSFSYDLESALDDLRESGEVGFERESKPDGPTYRYLHHDDGGAISPAKKEIIRHVHQETASWTTEKLAEFSKQTWLYENAGPDDLMDFETYCDDIIIPAEERERVSEQDGNPSTNDSPIDELLEH